MQPLGQKFFGVGRDGRVEADTAFLQVGLQLT
jgi:hypothetical protein